MAGRFAKYSKEEGQDVRPFKQKKATGTRRMKAMLRLLELYEDLCTNGNQLEYEKLIRTIKRRGLRFVPQDITNFSVEMKRFEADYNFNLNAGRFLMALINASENGLYHIITNHLTMHLHEIFPIDGFNMAINDIGYRNRKFHDIEVFGDVGSLNLDSMEGGRIAVHGNLGSIYGGNQRSGQISIDGDLIDMFVDFAEAGIVCIGGSIHLLRVHFMSPAMVFHKGNLIYANKRLLDTENYSINKHGRHHQGYNMIEPVANGS
ncbi:MAG: hypothetical protein V1827_06335 [Candidatus Micrarchaeota archaeon]